VLATPSTNAASVRSFMRRAGAGGRRGGPWARGSRAAGR
jgi:hypothetical protein